MDLRDLRVSSRYRSEDWMCFKKALVSAEHLFVLLPVEDHVKRTK
jgi:hypothetical protein